MVNYEHPYCWYWTLQSAACPWKKTHSATFVCLRLSVYWNHYWPLVPIFFPQSEDITHRSCMCTKMANTSCASWDSLRKPDKKESMERKTDWEVLHGGGGWLKERIWMREWEPWCGREEQAEVKESKERQEESFAAVGRGAFIIN